MLELFFIFFNCYINMLKARCNLYLYQTDVFSCCKLDVNAQKASGKLFLKGGFHLKLSVMLRGLKEG